MAVTRVGLHTLNAQILEESLALSKNEAARAAKLKRNTLSRLVTEDEAPLLAVMEELESPAKVNFPSMCGQFVLGDEHITVVNY